MTRHLVDPEIDAMLDQFPRFEFTPESLPAIRSAMDDMFAQQSTLIPPFPDVEVSERYVPGPAGSPDVRVLVYLPKQAPRPVAALLWIHGGGYVIGKPEMDDFDLKQKVTDLQCAVVAVDYRLAPETPFPGPVEDCYAALKWLHQSSANLGVDLNRLAIGGASAGGGLAAALGLLTRDRGEIPLAFQLLIYPMLDDRTVTTSDPHGFTGEFIWTPQSNHFGWSALLGQAPGSPDVSPYAAPARAESLAGLPPTFICAGALDLFLEEDMEYARRLIRVGVPTELHIYPGAFHAFNLVTTAQVAQAYTRDHINALRRVLNPSQMSA
jgi:acetyl esterase/lipase